MSHLTIESQVVVQRYRLAIDSRTNEPLLEQIDEQVKAIISDVEDFAGESSTTRDDTCLVGFQRLPE